MSAAPGPDRRRRPVGHIAISAGHELFASREAALEATVADRLQRRIEIRTQHALGRSWCPYAVESTRINRSIEGGVDDIKFLYPVLDNIPVIVPTLLNFAYAGLPLCLYGSPEICRVAEIVRDYLLEIGWLRDRGDLLTVTEDTHRNGFFDSFRRSTGPLLTRPDDVALWSAGDLVLAYDIWPWLLDRDIDDHDLVVNMIARRLICAPGTPEFVRLEFFDSLRHDGEATAREARQPDMLLFTGRGRDGLAGLERIRGRPEAALFAILLKATWRGLLGAKAGSMLHAIGYGIRRRRYSLRPGRGLAQRHAGAFASVFFGVPTRVKADSGDPFIVKDADGFEEIFGYYRTLLQRVVDSGTTREDGYAKLADYYPHACHLFRLSERLAPLWSEIPLWRQWTEFIRDKTATYNVRLGRAFAEAGVADSAAPVPEYFSADGSFRFHPAPSHSDIAASLGFLAGPYRDRYERGRETWTSR